MCIMCLSKILKNFVQRKEISEFWCRFSFINESRKNYILYVLQMWYDEAKSGRSQKCWYFHIILQVLKLLVSQKLFVQIQVDFLQYAALQKCTQSLQVEKLESTWLTVTLILLNHSKNVHTSLVEFAMNTNFSPFCLFGRFQRLPYDVISGRKSYL